MQKFHCSLFFSENSLTYYYSCCGELRNKCCYNTRTWVLVASIAVPFIILIAIIIVLIRKFCVKRNDEYIPGQRQMSEQPQKNYLIGRRP